MCHWLLVRLGGRTAARPSHLKEGEDDKELPKKIAPWPPLPPPPQRCLENFLSVQKGLSTQPEEQKKSDRWLRGRALESRAERKGRCAQDSECISLPHLDDPRLRRGGGEGEANPQKGRRREGQSSVGQSSRQSTFLASQGSAGKKGEALLAAGQLRGRPPLSKNKCGWMAVGTCGHTAGR